MITARPFALIAIALTLLLGACASTPADDTTAEDAPSATATDGDAEIMANDADLAFLRGMVPHHAQAVEMAEMVEGRTAHPDELGGLAEEIIATQQSEIDLMNDLLARAGEEPVDGGDMSMDGMDHGDDMEMGGMEMGGMMTADDMTTLEGLEGDAFDQLFLEMMIAHHVGAIEAAERVLAEGESAEVSDLADDVIEAQRAEIEQMEAWQSEWAA
jgi:uncharacterized protein (DUF305 family)